MIVGFSGCKGSGKDTAASFLIKELGYERRGFADKLKEAVSNLFDIPLQWVDEFKNNLGYTIDLVEVHINVCDSPIQNPGGGKQIYVERKADREYVYTWREFLQRFGTEMGRQTFGSSFWVDQVLPKDERPIKNIVLPDVRFDNEAMRIIQLGGRVYEILRPGHEPDGHASEVGISKPFVHAQIANDGSIEDFRKKVLHEVR